MSPLERMRVAAAEFVIAEAAVLRFQGERTGAEFDAAQAAWQRATVNLAKAGRAVGRGCLARLGAAFRFDCSDSQGQAPEVARALEEVQ